MRSKVVLCVVGVLVMGLIVGGSLGMIPYEEIAKLVVGTLFLVVAGGLCIESAYVANDAKRQGSHGVD